MSDANTPMEPQGAYEEVYVDMPQWPKAIGIVSIIWSGIGLTCLGCGVAGMAAGQAFMTDEMRAQSPPMNFGLLDYGSMGASGLNAVVLLIAGILTLRRSISGRWLHLIYALVSLPMFGLGVWLTMGHQHDQTLWYSQNPDSPGAKMMAGGSGGVIKSITLGVQIIFGLGYPVFLLIWFGLVKRSGASMTGMPDDSTVAAGDHM